MTEEVTKELTVVQIAKSVRDQSGRDDSSEMESLPELSGQADIDRY